jgi:hypothetical protein
MSHSIASLPCIQLGKKIATCKTAENLTEEAIRNDLDLLVAQLWYVHHYCGAVQVLLKRLEFHDRSALPFAATAKGTRFVCWDVRACFDCQC